MWAEPFLKGVEKTNSVGKRKEYEESLRVLGSIVYGKQWEYWEQIRLMAEKGEEEFKARRGGGGQRSYSSGGTYQSQSNRQQGSQQRYKNQSSRQQSYEGSNYQQASKKERVKTKPFKAKREFMFNRAVPEDERRNSQYEADRKDSEKSDPIATEIRNNGRIPLFLRTQEKVYAYSVPSEEPTEDQAREFMESMKKELEKLAPEDNGKKLILLGMVRADIKDIPEADKKVRNALMRTAVEMNWD
jgi:hypothetical protein